MSTEPRKPTSLAEQLRAAVNESEWTINAIAGAAGIKQSVLYRFATGQRDSIRLETADRLCAIFRMKLTTPKPISAKQIGSEGRTS